MNSALIILVLLALAVGVVVWVVRRKPDAPRVGPQDGDTAWNDPVTPGEPARPNPNDPRP